MILYHGSDVQVSHPDIAHSKAFLDFGKGFYTTTVREQAERWAKRKALLADQSSGIVNLYEAKDFSSFKVLSFGEDTGAWLDFVCDCRNGAQEYLAYDVICGKVADDKVFQVVDLYKRGIWDKNRAIREMRIYETYDQIAFISQKAIDNLLVFQSAYEVTL